MGRLSKAEIERRARAEAYAQRPRFEATSGWPMPSFRIEPEGGGVLIYAADEGESAYTWLTRDEALGLRDWLIANFTD